MDLSRLKSEFPAPSFRATQESALESIRASFKDGNDIVLVQAPTGSGKSLLARAVAGCARRKMDDSVGATGAYYVTPQVSQLDDVAGDEFLSDFQIVRGKGNYRCVHPDHDDVPVTKAPCERISSFDCDYLPECPYFEDKNGAQSGRIAAMTLAYFFEHAPPIGSFDARDVIVVDEAHGLLDWAEMYGTTRLDTETVPDWDRVAPSSEFNSLAEMADWAGHVHAELIEKRDNLSRLNRLDMEEAGVLSRLQRVTENLSWFLEEYRDESLDAKWLYEQPKGAGGPVKIRPINPERVLHHTLWKRGDKFLFLSATLLNKNAFCHSVGIDPSRVGFVQLEHTFPLKHRVLFDVMDGKMTYDHRDDTLPKIAETIERVMHRHYDQKGLVHCHSYAIQEQLEDLLSDRGLTDRIWTHNKKNRDQRLEEWKQSNEPTAFLSVKMEEALDLSGDLARWQVLCKAPYPNTKDPQVAERLENGHWPWYYRQTLATVIQACGRIIRSPDDWGATYLADESFEDLFENSRSDMPPWFEEQVDNILEPDLPTLQTARN